MLFRFSLFFSLLLAGSAVASEQTFTKQFDAAPGGSLVVDVDFGAIDIAPSGDGRVAIEVHRKIDSRDAAREKAYFESTPVLVTQAGSVITVRVERKEGDRSWNWGDHVTTDARYTIRLPQNFHLDLHTGGGDILAKKMEGAMKAHTNGGAIKFGGLTGPIDAKTNGGHIELEGCQGLTKIATNGGNILASNGSGTLDARTSGGAIVVRHQRGDTGVRSNGGQLTLEGVEGRLTGKTNGGSISAVLAGATPGETKLETASGNIHVTVPANAGMNVKADGTSIDVLGGLPFAGASSGHDSLVGKINGGGQELHLRTGAGNISLTQSGGETAQR